MLNNPMQMLMQILQMGNNPNQIVQDLLIRDPRYQVMLNQLQQSGMSPRQYAEQLCRQNNVDMSSIHNLFNQRGIKL